MKKVLLTILAGLPALAFAQTPFVVKGKVANVSAPSKIFLLYRKDSKNVIDSTVIKDGQFTFEPNVKDITSAQLLLDYKGVGYNSLDRRKKQDVLSFYLSPGTVTLNSADSIAKSKITGSKVNDDNALYKAFIKPATDKSAKLNAEYAATPAETRKTKEFMEPFEKRADEIDKERTDLTKAFIKAHTDSYLSLLLISSIGGPYPEYTDLAPYYNDLAPAVKSTTSGVALAARLEKLKHVALGAMAPEFAQADTSGKMVSLSSFHGKYLLVDFWASWCGPCRAENPNVVKAFNKYKDKNFTILGVSLDQPGARDKWIAAIKKDGLNWTQVSDLQFWNNAASTAYGVQAIPQNYLLDPSGKIIGKNLRAEDLENKLAEIFGKI